ncbi:MAG: hypothetical protein Q9182_007048 [Xanthomendoza sp. 2 TL-2023]
MSHQSFMKTWKRNAVYVILLFFIITLSQTTAKAISRNDLLLDTVPKDATLVRRYHVITTEEYEGDIRRTGKVYSLPAVFWTSFPRSGPIREQGFMTSKTWAKKTFGEKGFVMYDTASDTYVEIMSPCDVPTTEQDILRVQHMSRAFGRAAYGVVYMLKPDDKPIYDTSIWAIFEWPELTRNHLVEKVIQVGIPSEQQTVLWRFGDGPKGDEPPPGKRRIKGRALRRA